MQPQHFAYIKENITAILNMESEIVTRYETGDFTRSDKVKDLQKRFNFDLMNFAVDPKFICNELYPYLNDTHIETALKSICPTIERRY